MAVYSHSRLSTYEDCPLKYRLNYIDRIKREEEGIEAFLGSRVHDTLQKCYDDLRFTKTNSLSDLLNHYNQIWQENWHDAISIMKQGLTPGHYRALGEKMIETYYNRYSPFDSDITLGTEVRLNFSLDDNNTYRMSGIIDRLARTRDDIYEIHDYKTSAHLPDQQEVDNERQLALYYFAVRKKWPHAENIRLIWHYLAFDTELVSYRTPDAISSLVHNTTKLIDEIESAEEFPAKESQLCGWCVYPDLCPLRKHFFKVEALPVNEYLNEPGVALVNKYVELKEKVDAIDKEIGKVREAILDYAKREQVENIKGSDRKVRVKFDKKLKFPAKNDEARKELDETILKTGKWMEVSQLDTASLTRIIENSLWSQELINQIMKYGKIDESASIYISRLKEEEK